MIKRDNSEYEDPTLDSKKLEMNLVTIDLRAAMRSLPSEVSKQLPDSVEVSPDIEQHLALLLSSCISVFLAFVAVKELLRRKVESNLDSSGAKAWVISAFSQTTVLESALVSAITIVVETVRAYQEAEKDG